MRDCRALFMMAACAPWLVATAAATPLDPPACAALQSEHDGLAAAGAQADLNHGPEWGKANLPPDRMQKVARLIELKEQLSFRCGLALTARPALKELPPEMKEKAGKQTVQPGDDVISGLTPSTIPPPKKKGQQDAPAATKKKRPAPEQQSE